MAGKLKLIFVLQLGFTDDIDPALSLKLISQSMLAFLNRHLPLTEAQRSLFRYPQDASQSVTKGDMTSDSVAMLSAPSHDMPDAANQSRNTHVTTHESHGQTDDLKPGSVVNAGLADGLSVDKTMSGRTCEFRVKAEERTVFEEVCNDHIAILELSL